ncbi:MAG: hypothetical protein ACFHW5_16310 [Verrucomicrobiota bacterium]
MKLLQYRDVKVNHKPFTHMGRSSFFRQWRGEFHLAPNFPLENVPEQKEWNTGKLLFID